jgi:hypothetical protein
MSRMSLRSDKITPALSSLKDIMAELEGCLHKPDIVDERRKRHFIEEVMPNSPPLRTEEIREIKKVTELKQTLEKRGKVSRELI